MILTQANYFCFQHVSKRIIMYEPDNIAPRFSPSESAELVPAQSQIHVREVERNELLGVDHIRFNRKVKFSEWSDFPIETIGSLVEFLSRKHESRKVLDVFTEENIVFTGGKFAIEGVEEFHTRKDSSYLENFSNLSDLIRDSSRFTVQTAHQGIEFGHILKEMKRTDLTYFHINYRLLCHPLVLTPSEILKIIAEIVEIFGRLDAGNISKIEVANILFIKRRFLHEMDFFKLWRQKKTPTLDLIVHREGTEEIMLLVQSFKDIVSAFIFV